MVAAQQQVRRLIGDALASSLELQTAGHRPRRRVDDLQDSAGDGDDPAAIGLDQVRLVHPGHIVVRTGIRRYRGRCGRGSARLRCGPWCPGGRRRVGSAVRRRGQTRKTVGADAGFGRLAQGGEFPAATMKRRQPHWTGPDGDVLMHSPLRRAARAARYHEQAASQDSSVLAAKVSCHAASTAAPAGRVPFGWSRSRSNQPVPSASPSRALTKHAIRCPFTRIGDHYNLPSEGADP